MLIDWLLQRLSLSYERSSFDELFSRLRIETVFGVSISGPKQNKVSTYFKHMDAVREYRIISQEATAVLRATPAKSLAGSSIFSPSHHIGLPTEQATKATTIPTRSVVSE
jgi:hypothetical protein